jgi:3-oxoadipate enol-lactonase
MPHMKIHGVNLYYEQAGAGQKVLLLIHGNVASSRWWDHIFAPLAERYKVVRVDLRGCGRSEGDGGAGNNVKQYSADLRALLKALGHEKAVLVGHSMGGAIAMDMAVNEPDLVEAMVLINSAPAEGIVTPEERKPLIEQMIRDRNLMKMALAAVVPTAATGEFFEKLVDDAMVAAPTMVPNYTSLGEADYREQLAGADLRTLIVYGQLDSLITQDMMERTQAVIPGSELVLYEGVGHSPCVEAPERLLQDIVRFVG